MSSEIENRLRERGITLDSLGAAMRQFSVETLSWGYGDSGTRFKVFHWPGAATTLREKLEDAAQVQRVTGICPGVAIHIPWDKVDDWQAVKEYAGSLGLRIGAVNPNLFQENDYRFGSLCHFDKKVREQVIAHVLECIQIAQIVDSNVISLWLADVLGAYRVQRAAYETDVRPLLAALREREGRHPDPIAAFRASGYAERVARERKAGAAGGGYPGA